MPTFEGVRRDTVMYQTMLMRGAVRMSLLGLCMLTGIPSAEAVITIKSASAVDGVAVVEGSNAARRASMGLQA
jgi:hypothetical protein